MPGSIMNDQELLRDLLNQEKEISKLYATSITESSCNNMRNVLHQNMQQTSQDQFSIFEQMTSRGFYPTEDVPASKMAQAKQKFQQMSSQLS